MNRESRELYLSLGICPVCCKNSLFGTERACAECRAREAGYKAKAYQKPDARQKMIETAVASKKKRKQQRREQGVCIECGKRKPRQGIATCSICREKANKQKRIRYEGRQTRKQWIAEGKCFLCGDECEAGYKVCAKHHQMSIENAQSIASVENRKRIKELGLVSAYVR